jgi:hypothetical protein
MSADNQQERFNYRLHYSASIGDLCRSFYRCDFFAIDDENALKDARRYVESQEDVFFKTQLLHVEKLQCTIN